MGGKESFAAFNTVGIFEGHSVPLLYWSMCFVSTRGRGTCYFIIFTLISRFPHARRSKARVGSCGASGSGIDCGGYGRSTSSVFLALLALDSVSAPE